MIMDRTSKRLYYLELQRRLRMLLISLAGSLPQEDIDFVSEFVDANEQGIALEVLSNLLVEKQAWLGRATLDEINSLVEAMGLEREVVDPLRGLVERNP
jgi:hypothetical protein